MKWLRYLLETASVVGVLFPLLIVYKEPDAWPLFIIAGLCLANLLYLLETASNKPPWRLTRIARLWLEAKETELKSRASHRAD